MAQDRMIVLGSERRPPPGSRIGPEPNDAVVQASLYLRADRLTGSLDRDGDLWTTRAEAHARRQEGLSASMASIAAFVRTAELTLVEADPARRLIRIEGSPRAMEAAFGTQLHRYRHRGREFRGRVGELSLPTEIAPYIEAVLGLDQRPIATPKSIRLANPAGHAGFLPNAVARLYGFPSPTGSGKGQTIALIELGGGFTASDTEHAFAAMGLGTPEVTAVSVPGGANQPGKDNGADGEVALDIQVAGGAAPGAKLAVYFAANTDQGFVDAISQAAHDQTNAPSVMSISWGSAEVQWTGQAVTAMTSALQDAVDLGVSVFAASGDGLATDGVRDGKAHVDFPASSPLVVGCGGTLLASAGGMPKETVWNSNGGGSGGGISDLFPMPDYQNGLKLPADVNGPRIGRGVPDVAADADPNTGYRVIVDGESEVIGGTSAAAPLWAGLFALINAATGKSSGQPHAALYAHPSAFNDITSGDNEAGGLGYKAAAGWDACTGLGSPKGAAVSALFTTGAGQNPPPV